MVSPPKGCPFSKPGTCWRLRKTLCGLRRSPRHWHQTFSGVLQDLGFTKCTHDPCTFIGTSPTGGKLCFGTCVGDCAHFESDDGTEQWFEEALGSKLKIDFMGPLSHHLGVHFVWGRTLDGRLTVHMSQAGHIHKMLEKRELDDPASLLPFAAGCHCLGFLLLSTRMCAYLSYRRFLRQFYLNS